MPTDDTNVVEFPTKATNDNSIGAPIEAEAPEEAPIDIEALARKVRVEPRRRKPESTNQGRAVPMVPHGERSHAYWSNRR